MLIKELTNILTIALLSSSLTSPINESYTIKMPLYLDLSKSGSFKISVEGSIAENDNILINFVDSFILSDKHGKANINGTINNPVISFDNLDNSEKEVFYSINNPSVGEWSGNLNVNIQLQQKAESNVIIDGNSLNAIFQQLNPTTITFTHDAVTGNYIYDLSVSKDESILLYQNGNEVIITNSIDSPIKANPDMSCLFKNLNVVTINNLEYIDMSNCTNMSEMFRSSNNLQNIDVSSFDTKNVTDMSYMFESIHACQNLIGLEHFDVSNVETFAFLLNNNMQFLSIPDLTGWNVTNKCKDTSYMFCNLGYTAGKYNKTVWPNTEFDFSNWDVSNVENMSNMFKNAFGLTTINLSNWNTSNVKDMSSMFEMMDSSEKSKLTTVIGLDKLNVCNVENMNKMFYECRVLDANNNFSSWQPTKVKDISYAFYNTRKLNIADFDNWDQYFDISVVNYTECFGSNAGSSTNKGYRPLWYK